MEDFSYMGMLGKIDMVNPEVTFVCYEECMYFVFQRSLSNAERMPNLQMSISMAQRGTSMKGMVCLGKSFLGGWYVRCPN